jgi:hypothetical protein
MPGCRCATSKRRLHMQIRGRRCGMTGPAAAWTGTRPTSLPPTSRAPPGSGIPARAARLVAAAAGRSRPHDEAITYGDPGTNAEPPVGAPVAAAPAAGGDMPSRMFCLVPVAWRDAASSGVGPCVAGQPVGGLGLRAAPAGGQCRWNGDRVRLRARRAEPAGRCPATATGTCTRRLRGLCQRTVAGAGRLGAHHDGYRGSGPVRVMGGSRRGDRDPVGDIPSGSRIGRWCRRGSRPGPAHRRRPATLVVRE